MERGEGGAMARGVEELGWRGKFQRPHAAERPGLGTACAAGDKGRWSLRELTKADGRVSSGLVGNQSGF